MIKVFANRGFAKYFIILAKERGWQLFLPSLLCTTGKLAKLPRFQLHLRSATSPICRALAAMPRGQSSGHRALAHLLATPSIATPKQAKELILPARTSNLDMNIGDSLLKRKIEGQQFQITLNNKYINLANSCNILNTYLSNLLWWTKQKQIIQQTNT
ncbi:hypothetical protein [Telluribacter sp.]|jgi:hypothetical protein|uniref:hypothetical protein n=1 Tax=Telluribacter sp. TaxID=1978767 RepID=UPI002E0FE021|nr:hypothetical protein [Telluribacter sp.]